MNDLDEIPDLSRKEVAKIFGSIVQDRITKLERLEKRPAGKHTAERIANLRDVIRNCYAAYYYLTE